MNVAEPKPPLLKKGVDGKTGGIAELKKRRQNRIIELEPKTKPEFYKDKYQMLKGQGKELEELRNAYIEILTTVAEKLLTENQNMLKEINGVEEKIRKRLEGYEAKQDDLMFMWCGGSRIEELRWVLGDDNEK